MVTRTNAVKSLSDEVVFSLPGSKCTVSARFQNVQRTELDYLIYNDPLGYADLILNGDPEEYLKNTAGSHGLEI